MTAEPRGPRPGRPRQPSPRGIAFLALLVAVWGSAGATAQLPGVETSFTVSDSVAELLEDDAPVVAAEMAQALAEIAKERFGFLSWAPGSGREGPRLEARMVETDSTCEPILELRLAYVLDSQERSFTDLADVLLYSSCDADRSLQSQAEFDVFRDKIETALAAFFDTDDERETIQAAFLAEIPLSDHLEIKHQQQAVFVPFAWRDLQATDESELKVEFTFATDPDLPPRPGNFHLRPKVEWLGLVQCEVKPFTFAGLVNVPQQTDYHEDLATLFSDSLTGMSLYMVKYKRDHNAAFRSAGSDALRDF